MTEDRDMLLLSVFTFITIFLWIFFELVKTSKTTTLTSNIQQIAAPMSPVIDVEVLSQLENRRTY